MYNLWSGARPVLGTHTTICVPSQPVRTKLAASLRYCRVKESSNALKGDCIPAEMRLASCGPSISKQYLGEDSKVACRQTRRR